MASIVALEGILGCNGFPITKDPFTIGRDSDNHLAIPDLTVSRHHCVIRRDQLSNHSFEIVDLDSINGVYVNDRKQERIPLAHGDRLSIGSCTFVFLLETEHDSLV